MTRNDMSNDLALHRAAIAEKIDTGTSSPDISRALVVFNTTGLPLSGVAVFRASLSWPVRQPLPPIAVTNMDGSPVPAAIRELSEAADTQGRLERRQLSFALHFAAADIPAHGWRTYIAAYADASSPLLKDDTPETELVVVETTRHGGDLRSTGNFPQETFDFAPAL